MPRTSGHKKDTKKMKKKDLMFQQEWQELQQLRAEHAALVEYFRTEDVAEGLEGDHRGDSTVQTALRLLRARRRSRRSS